MIEILYLIFISVILIICITNCLHAKTDVELWGKPLDDDNQFYDDPLV